MLPLGRAKNGKNRITEKFIDGAFVIENYAGHLLKVAIEQCHDLRRWQVLSQAREPTNIGHHDGDFTQVTAEFQSFGCFE